ncbi:hypothetical protein DASC09_058640 [Saccharomycopsis crataegensis]|uniref:Ubiquitin-like domain-containing protein n=1 Tax=Saccharomycopsis crataegensis TaxID=43959 RepID=A0AAV5QWI4_9ASCO|nr:hypothetical protein DASC09_058640 [Saccharomycopsis crataegensis]
MTDIFKVPGGWDNHYHSHKRAHSIYSDNSSKSDFSFDRKSILTSDSTSTYSAESIGYKNFMIMAKGKNPSNNNKSANTNNKNSAPKKKQKPITVRIENDRDQSAYQFPYEYTNTWSGFQQSLRDAFPRYRQLISKGELVIINKNEECAFIPQHYNTFVKPGQELFVKFQRQPKNQFYMKEYERGSNYESDEISSDDEYNPDHPRSPRKSNKPKKKSSATHRIVNWLTE